MRKNRFYSTLKHGKLKGGGNNIYAGKAYRGGFRVDVTVWVYFCSYYPFFPSAERDHDYDDRHALRERDHDHHHYVPGWDATLQRRAVSVRYGEKNGDYFFRLPPERLCKPSHYSSSPTASVRPRGNARHSRPSLDVPLWRVGHRRAPGRTGTLRTLIITALSGG